MGFLTKPDSIGALTYSSGVITLQPSRLTIGGQQYRVPTLNVALSGLTANSLYMVFVVMTGPSSFQLVVSANYNSVGPAGYTKWKLVSAFYSNGNVSVSFGSFIKDLYGSPETNPIVFDPAVVAFGSITSPIFNWTRYGSRCRTEFTFTAGIVSGATALVGVPHTGATSVGRILAGKWNGDVLYSGALVLDVGDKNNFRFANDANNWGVYLTGTAMGNNNLVGAFADYPVAAFDNTPIAYL